MVPLSMGMMEMKVPFSTVLSFLVSAPITNFVIVALIMGMFGWKIALVYFIWTFIAAVLAGVLLGNTVIKNDVKVVRFSSSNGNPDVDGLQANAALSQESGEVSCSQLLNSSISSTTSLATNMHTSFWPQHLPRIKSALSFAKVLFKMIIPYAVAGAAISGLAAAFLPASIVEQYVGDNNLMAIPIAAAIGVPLYLRIEMAMPLLAVLMAKGMGIGAAMALLIGGTGASLPELAILSAMLKPRAVAVYTFYVFLVAMIGGFVFQFLV
jgi:uncharacterized protein